MLYTTTQENLPNFIRKLRLKKDTNTSKVSQTPVNTPGTKSAGKNSERMHHNIGS
jgi:hypothetical protein